MKTLFSLVVCTLVLLGSHDAFAAENSPSHYEGEEIHSSEQALKTIQAGYMTIKGIIDGGDLNADNMELVHETTYSIEDAVAYLNKSPKMDFTDFSTLLEGVHLSSESKQPGLMKGYFKGFQKEVLKFYSAYNLSN